jgi:hypothetical protein
MGGNTPKKTPLERLVADFLPAASPVGQAVEQQVARIQEPPALRGLSDLRTPVYGNDPTELLKHRFLYRGGLALLCGPTGIGKSSLLMQAAIHWSIGRPFFSIEPGDCFRRSGMSILLVQAENDEGDLAEMRNGVLAGCTDLSDTDKQWAGERIRIATITDKSADAFAAVIEALLTEAGPFDLVLIDPAFAYLGGDGSSQRDVSHFMRELLNPLAQKHGAGVILAHHTNKPLNGKEKDSWSAGDFAYLGAGSAEWINPARAAIALRSVGSDTVFELRAVKRGRRLRWVDENGLPTTVQHIAHHTEPGVICWRLATPEEVDEVQAQNGPKRGRKKEHSEVEAVHAVRARPGENQEVYLEMISDGMGCSKMTSHNLMKAAVSNGWLIANRSARTIKYLVSIEGEKAAKSKPSTVSWVQ